MGKQPQAQTFFHWQRRQPGHHSVMVDGIDYHAKKLGWSSWEMTAYVYRGSEAIPMVVASTWAQSLRNLQITVRRSHTEIRARAHAMTGATLNAFGAAVGPNLLALLHRDSTACLQIVHERHGWFVTVTVAVPDTGKPKRVPVFRATAAEALRVLDDQVATRFRTDPVVVDAAPDTEPVAAR